MDTNCPDILVIGDCDIDLYMKVGREALSESSGKVCFFHGTKIPIEEFKTNIAGNACNVAVGCNKLKLNTAVYTELGDDANADIFINEFRKLGIDTTFCIKNPNTPTNVHPIIIYNNERTIFSYHEVRNYKVKDWPKPKWIYYTSLSKGFEIFQAELVDYLKNNSDIGVAVNPATFQLKAGVEHLKNILRITHVLFVNKEEAQTLTKQSLRSGELKNIVDVRKLHEYLHELGPKITVITDGKNGAGAFDGSAFETTPSITPSKEIADKTGAGDAFSSGFLSALFYGKSLKTALKWGALNSSNVLTEIGATKGLLNKKDMEKLHV